MKEAEVYRILMNERWVLEDLYSFPHAYSQSQSFIYCFDTELDPSDARRIDYALEEYPWQGGYSYVNLYKVLHYQVPTPHRPTIVSIQYSSQNDFIDIVDTLTHGLRGFGPFWPHGRP